MSKDLETNTVVLSEVFGRPWVACLALAAIAITFIVVVLGRLQAGIFYRVGACAMVGGLAMACWFLEKRNRELFGFLQIAVSLVVAWVALGTEGWTAARVAAIAGGALFVRRGLADVVEGRRARGKPTGHDINIVWKT